MLHLLCPDLIVITVGVVYQKVFLLLAIFDIFCLLDFQRNNGSIILQLFQFPEIR